MDNQPTTYNGWTNHSTWSLNLWMNNEEGIYHFFTEAARACLAKDFTIYARAYAETKEDELDPNEVNYEEIREGFLEGQE